MRELQDFKEIASKQNAPVSQSKDESIVDLGVTEESKRYIRYTSPQQSNEMLFSICLVPENVNHFVLGDFFTNLKANQGPPSYVASTRM